MMVWLQHNEFTACVLCAFLIRGKKLCMHASVCVCVCVSLWLYVCVCVCVYSTYPVDCYLSVFSPTQKLSAPIPPLSHPLRAPALPPWLPHPPRTLCGPDCALRGRPTPKGDWVRRCTLRYPSCWPRLGRLTCLRGSCWTAEDGRQHQWRKIYISGEKTPRLPTV